METYRQPDATVIVNEDGSLDPESLKALPANIAEQLGAQAPFLRILKPHTGRRESRRGPIRTFHVEDMRPGYARNIVKDRRPEGMSGRQWKRSQRLARKIAHATIRGDQ